MLRSRRALTIIELLVVAAIIALLIAILLPAFSMAREQSRIGVCLSNMRSIAIASHSYITENSDLPWTLPVNMIASGASSNQYSFSNPSAFIYGGSIPDKTTEEFRNASPVAAAGQSPAEYDVYRVPPRLRPLNRYLAPEVSWDCEPNPDLDVSRPDPTFTPGFFRCPSDTFAKTPTIGRQTPLGRDESEYSTWQFWGSSYATNWYWAIYYLRAPPGNQPPYSGGGSGILLYRLLGFYSPSPPGLGRYLLRSGRANWPGEFILFMENSLNFSLEMARPPGYEGGPWYPGAGRSISGWHRQKDRHIATFLDGSVRYQTMDSRFLLGDRWTIWPSRPWEGAWNRYSENVP
ncbi:MAG: hypothetical protein HZB38_08085 [Planctomycetes bacterium]|nr:hypothetical protein [Planctomycetota bacterium]